MILKKIILCVLLISFAITGTDGTIRGKVTDIEGEPLPGAMILIEELGIGTMSDLEGNYILLNVQVGTYDITVSMLSYAIQVRTDVDVMMDQTQWLNFNMTEEAIKGEKIIVKYRKIDKQYLAYVCR